MLWEEKGEDIYIYTPLDFSFTENLRYLARSTNECLFQIHGNKVRKAISVEDYIALIEISANEEHSLQIHFLGNSRPARRRVREQVVMYIVEWFDLKTDLNPFYELAQKDFILQGAVEEHKGLRIIGIQDLFEAMAWGILGQQINLTYAYTLKRRLVEKYGRSLEYNGQTYWIFPSPSDIAKLTIDDLADIKMTVKKCEYLIEVAKRIESGLLTKEILLETPDIKVAEKILTTIRGIGPWTANYVLMRCLRFPAAFPIDDVGLQNAIKFVLGSNQKPSKKELLELSQPWKGWEAYATFYLWRLLY